MPRIPNTRPTSIYWLIDIRPETISAGWINGKPFYCGKTIEETNRRLIGHRFVAKRYPNRLTSKRIVACGAHVRIQTMEIVPFADNWQAREKRWIWLLRGSFSDTTNVSDGGDGVPGMIPSEKTRAKISAGRKGWSPSDETRARMSAAKQRMSSETRAKIGVISRNRSPETRARMSASALNRSPEYRLKISIAKRGKPHSDETRAKISASLTGKRRKPFSVEHRLNLGIAKRGTRYTTRSSTR
jgi:hypothetical protein